MLHHSSVSRCLLKEVDKGIPDPVDDSNAGFVIFKCSPPQLERYLVKPSSQSTLGT